MGGGQTGDFWLLLTWSPRVFPVLLYNDASHSWASTTGWESARGKSAVCRSIWKISARVGRLLQHRGHSGLTKPTLALLFKWQLQIWSAATSKQTPKVHSEKSWECAPTQGHHCLGPVSAGQKPWRSTNPEEQCRPESLDQSKLQFPEGIRTFINTHAFRMRTPSEIPRYCWLASQSRPHPLSSLRMQRNKWGFASSLVYGFKLGNLEIPQISYKSRYLGPRMLSSHLRFGMSECPSRISVRTTDWGIFWHCSLRAKLKADKINFKKKKLQHILINFRWDFKDSLNHKTSFSCLPDRVTLLPPATKCWLSRVSLFDRSDRFINKDRRRRRWGEKGLSESRRQHVLAALNCLIKLIKLGYDHNTL